MFAQLWQDSRLRLAVVVGLAITALYLAVHIPPIFNVLGNTGYLWFSDTLAFLMALIATLICVRLWLAFETGERQKLIWGALALGLGLWTLGELIWAIFELIVGQELPYPSLADIAYVLGFIPLYVALIMRYRNLGRKPSSGQLILFITIALVFLIVAAVFVIGPVVTYVGYEQPVEQVLDVLYPVGDLGLAILALLLMLTMSGGEMSRSWSFLTAGFLIISGSDLLFSYTTWNELFAYDGMNLITAVVNSTYFLSYVLLAFGFLVQARLHRAV